MTDADATDQAVCVLPQGSEEGREVRLSDRKFALKVGQPVNFPLASLNEDTPPPAGAVVVYDPERFVRLPPVVTQLAPQPGDTASEYEVELAAFLNESGTLQVQCISTANDHCRWDLHFALRAAPDTHAGSSQQISRTGKLAEAEIAVARVYGKKAKASETKAAKGLRQDLENLLGERESWTSGTLRALAEMLLETAAHRRRSAEHERAWFALLGYTLRPGLGFPGDETRMQQLWALYAQGLQFHPEPQNWTEWWTLWRRVAAGLDENQQMQLFQATAEFLLIPNTKRPTAAGAAAKKRGYDAMIRMAGALENLPIAQKIALGDSLWGRLSLPGEPNAIPWAIGRIGARTPFHGSAHRVLPHETAMEWADRLLALDWRANPGFCLTAALLGRRTGDRERDLDDATRVALAQRLKSMRAPQSWIDMVLDVVELSAEDSGNVFGELLPAGLRLLP